MLSETKTEYANGQRTYHREGQTLTYYFKDGTVKAYGPYIDDKMEGQWHFYRKTGQLWQVGYFLHQKKHGVWRRYSEDGTLEYERNFVDGLAGE